MLHIYMAKSITTGSLSSRRVHGACAVACRVAVVACFGLYRWKHGRTTFFLFERLNFWKSTTLSLLVLLPATQPPNHPPCVRHVFSMVWSCCLNFVLEIMCSPFKCCSPFWLFRLYCLHTLHAHHDLSAKCTMQVHTTCSPVKDAQRLSLESTDYSKHCSCRLRHSWRKRPLRGAVPSRVWSTINAANLSHQDVSGNYRRNKWLNCPGENIFVAAGLQYIYI